MNNIKNIGLYKSRGYTACISTAFNTFAHNLKTIFLHTWWSALAVAVVSSFYVSATVDVAANGLNAGNAACLSVGAVLSLCATVALYARAATLVNGRKMGWNAMRLTRLMLLTLVFYIVVGIVLGLVSELIVSGDTAEQSLAAIPVASITVNAGTLVICLLTLPYLYVFFKYLSEPEARLRRLLLKGYRTGLRHWGFIFTTVFLTYLCVAVCAVILALPAVIIMAARTVSIAGVTTLGDPSGLPAYFDALQFGLFTLAMFIWSYISIAVLFVYFFVYGSIETREKERKAFLADSETTETDNQQTEK